MTYALSATQLESVLRLVQGLNSSSEDIDLILDGNDDKKQGDGHLLMLESPIRIISDAPGGGEPEVFGWVYEDEFGWDFTQTDPTKK